MTIPTLTQVTDTKISAIGHDPKNCRLFIQFKRDGQPSSIYSYENFSIDEYVAFACADSLGSHFHRFIKYHPDKYPYNKLT